VGIALYFLQWNCLISNIIPTLFRPEASFRLRRSVQFAGNLEVRALAHSQNRRAYLAKSMYLKQQLHIKRSLTAHSGKTLNTAADKSRPGLCW